MDNVKRMFLIFFSHALHGTTFVSNFQKFLCNGCMMQRHALAHAQCHCFLMGLFNLMKNFGQDQLETSKPLSSWDLDMETVENGHVVVWTDGACSAHTIPYLRRAGYGVAYDKDLSHSRSISLPLAGPEQSAQRAEVRALLAIMAIESRPLWVRSDSKYTVDVFNQIVSGYSLPSDRAPRSLATNRDPVLSSI